MSPTAPTEAAPLMLSVASVARRLGLSPYQVKGLIGEGKLRSDTVRSRTYVFADSFDAYTAGRETA